MENLSMVIGTLRVNSGQRSAMMMATFFEAVVCIAFLCLLCL